MIFQSEAKVMWNFEKLLDMPKNEETPCSPCLKSIFFADTLKSYFGYVYSIYPLSWLMMLKSFLLNKQTTYLCTYDIAITIISPIFNTQMHHCAAASMGSLARPHQLHNNI